MKNSKPNIRSVSVDWGGVKAQNNFTNPDSSYNHISKVGKSPTEKKSGDYTVLLRGSDNFAPQKDIELGKKSITHRKIADKIALLVGGKGLSFYVEAPERGVDNLTEVEQAELDRANSFLKIGLNEALTYIANGVVYQSLGGVIITQSSPKPVNGIVTPSPIYFAGVASERLRYSLPKMNERAIEVIDYHFYHKDWGFTGDCEKDRKPKLPPIISIEKYIALSQKGEPTKEAFAVNSIDNVDSKMSKYISVAIAPDSGIFDGAYPLPSWKTNSSINDIDNEFEASCIRTDFLRNGLHISALVNVYSTRFNVVTDADSGFDDDSWADDLSVVQSLKNSFNSGKIIVNALGTTDPEKDGKIEVEKIELAFPADTYAKISEEGRSGILTAWGVTADLFGVSKSEGSNLRSQEGFLKMAILMLKENINIYQKSIERGVNKILEYYGITKVKSRIEDYDSGLFLVVMAELGKEFMQINEVREQILGLKSLSEEELLKITGSLRKVSNNNQNPTQ